MSKRNEILIAQDRARVCDLLRMGYRSKTEIASILNENRDKNEHITPAQVANDIEFMRNMYLEQGLEDYNIYRNQILDEINMLQRTYWKGYDLSRRSKITIESESVVDNEEYDILREEGLGLRPDEDIFNRNIRAREETRAEGNPAFLQGVQACIDRKSKIYGIDAPNKVALTDPSGTKEASSAVELMKQRMDELSERLEPKLLNE